MEVRICKACHKEKSIKQFYRNNQSKDGYEGKCKQCKINRVRIYEKKPRKTLYFGDWNDYFRLVNPTLQDYCLTYTFLENLGFNLEKDIHTQFCEKYNLQRTDRKKKDENKYFHFDCK